MSTASGQSDAGAAATVRLTERASCAGCAAKLGASELTAALASLHPTDDPRLLVGHATLDDAAVFQLTPDIALVQTVDFFPAIVDDPYAFGQIAAANALSDVYAMGGQPLTALNIVGFPSGELPPELLASVLRGGHDKVREAGALIVGGHSIIDRELKYGLAVTGRAHPRFILTNSAARPGDRLVLTKPLGTGIATTAARSGAFPSAELHAVIESMTTLNGAASRAALAVGARCATDVTGFGLLGHAVQLADASSVTLRIEAGRVPAFRGVRDAIAAGHATGGAARNLEYVAGRVSWGRCSDEARALVLDPQTSGGLLMALAPARAARLVARLPGARDIGCVTARGRAAIVIE